VPRLRIDPNWMVGAIGLSLPGVPWPKKIF